MNIKNREKFLLIAAGSIVGLLLADQLIFSPLITAWKKRGDKIQEMQKRLDDGKTRLTKERETRDGWMSIKTHALPANPSDAEGKILQSVDRWTRVSGLKMTSVKPQWKQSARDEDYMTLDCQYDGSGNIQSVTRFIYELEKEPMALRIDELKVNARDDGGQQLALSIRFSGLKLNPDQK